MGIKDRLFNLTSSLPVESRSVIHHLTIMTATREAYPQSDAMPRVAMKGESTFPQGAYPSRRPRCDVPKVGL